MLTNSNAEGIAIIDGHIAIQYQNTINFYTPMGIRPPSDLNLTGYDDIDINSNSRLMLLNSTDGVINLFNFAGGSSGSINLPDSTVFAITRGDNDTIYALREVDDGGGGTDITVVSVNADGTFGSLSFINDVDVGLARDLFSITDNNRIFVLDETDDKFYAYAIELEMSSRQSVEVDNNTSLDVNTFQNTEILVIGS